MIAYLTDPDTWAALFTLSVLEIVLGVDNLIFLAISSSQLPPAQQARARRTGLALALLLRVGLLATLTMIAKLTMPIFTVGEFSASWRDVVLGVGGLYLIYKGGVELRAMGEEDEGKSDRRVPPQLFAIVLQITVLDLVFSLDSIVTAVGMTDNLPVMIAAIVIAMAVMLFAAGPVSDFISRHRTVKMLAFAFLLMIGTALVADACHFHIPREYLYAAIVFSILLEALNIWLRGDGDRQDG
jgi:predicted tellurium resistance membrane protein TerC